MNFKSVKDLTNQRNNNRNSINNEKIISGSPDSFPRSPYLSSEKMQVMTHCITKNRGIADLDHNRAKTISGKLGQPSRSKMKKSVLTLPTTTCEPPSCPHCHDGVEQCGKCRGQTKTKAQKHRSRHAKPTGDKLVTDSEPSPKAEDEKLRALPDRIKRKLFQEKSVVSVQNPACVVSRIMTPERDLSSHDVWNLLREMNRRQFIRTAPKISDDSFSHARPRIRKPCKRGKNARITELRRKKEVNAFSRIALENTKKTISNSSSLTNITIVELRARQEKGNQRTQFTSDWMCDNANRLANEKALQVHNRVEDKNDPTFLQTPKSTVTELQHHKGPKKSVIENCINQPIDCMVLGKTSNEIHKNVVSSRYLNNLHINPNIKRFSARTISNVTKETAVNRNHQEHQGNIYQKKLKAITYPNLKYPIVILGKDVCATVTVPVYTAPQFANMKGIWQYMIGWSINYAKDNAKPNKYLTLLANQGKTHLLKLLKTPTTRIQRKLNQRNGIRKKDNIAKYQIENRFNESSKDLKVLFQNVNDFEVSTIGVNKGLKVNKRSDIKDRSKTAKFQSCTAKRKQEQLGKSSSDLRTSSPERKAIIDIVLEKVKVQRAEPTINVTENSRWVKQNALKACTIKTQSKVKLNAKVQETINQLEHHCFYNAVINCKEKRFEKTLACNRIKHVEKSSLMPQINTDERQYDTIQQTKKEEIVPMEEISNTSDKNHSTLRSRKALIKKYFVEPLISSKASPTTAIQKTLVESVTSEDFVSEMLSCLAPNNSSVNKIEDSTIKNSQVKEILPRYDSRQSKSKEALNAKIEKVLSYQFYDYDDWARNTLLKTKKCPFRQRWTISKRKRNSQPSEVRDAVKSESPKAAEIKNKSPIQKEPPYKHETKTMIRKTKKKYVRKCPTRFLTSPTSNDRKVFKEDFFSIHEQEEATKTIPGFDKWPLKVILKIGSNEVTVEIPAKNIIVHFDLTDNSMALNELGFKPELEETFSLSLLKIKGKQRYKVNQKLCMANLPEQICSMWPMLCKTLEKCSLVITENPSKNLANAIEDVLNNRMPQDVITKNMLKQGHLNIKNCRILLKNIKSKPRHLNKLFLCHSREKDILRNINVHFVEDCATVHSGISKVNVSCANQECSRPALSTGFQNLLGAVKCSYTPWFVNQSDSNWTLRHLIDESIRSLAKSVKSQRCMNSMVRLHQENVHFLTFSLSEKVIERFILLISSDNFRLLFYRTSGMLDFTNSASINLNDKDHTLLESLNATTKNDRELTNMKSFRIKNRRKRMTRVNFLKRNVRVNRRNFDEINKGDVPVDRVKSIKDFMNMLGGAFLSEVIGKDLAKTISAGIREFAAWSNRISPAQALLMLLLSRKPETRCLYKFRRGLVQAIATRRIESSSDLDQECRLIELDADAECMKDGDDKMIVDELYHIAKKTALEHERPFNEDSERTLDSLVRRQRKLNPSYLRVMAKYVGLGLFTSPSKENLRIAQG